MEESIKLEMTKFEAEQFSIMAETCLKQIRAANEQMDQHEREIERLDQSTDEIISQIREMLHVEAALGTVRQRRNDGSTSATA